MQTLYDDDDNHHRGSTSITEPLPESLRVNVLFSQFSEFHNVFECSNDQLKSNNINEAAEQCHLWN